MVNLWEVINWFRQGLHPIDSLLYAIELDDVADPSDGLLNDLSEEAAALLESLVNNHPFVDGNERVGFAAAHTFLLMNGIDLDVSSKAAFEFLIRAISDGKFRFALLHEWIAAHLVPLSE